MNLLKVKSGKLSRTSLDLVEEELSELTLSELRILLCDVKDMISDREAGLDDGDSL